MEHENEQRVYYRRGDGTPSSVAGVVDAKTDPLFILVKRRRETVKIRREQLDFISEARGRPGGTPV